MKRLLELIADRSGKLSAYKLAFIVGAFAMLYCIMENSLHTQKLADIPQTWIYFLGVLGGSQLTATMLKNKEGNVSTSTEKVSSTIISTSP